MTHYPISAAQIAEKIDHTLLKPTLVYAELEKLCDEAKRFSFKTVCVPPAWVPDAVKLLQGSSVLTITVVGFPLGYSLTETKALEAKFAIAQGAQEIDMVINVSFLKSQRYSEIQKDIEVVVQACGPIPLKVIIETAYLTDEEKIKVAKIAEAAGAAFVKTSTGFATGVANAGATLADIELLRKNLKPSTQIKASGGIRDHATAVAMIQAGADRLGTSSGVSIVSDAGSSAKAPEGTY